MSDEGIEIIKGSGNVFADLDLPNSDIEHMKAILAAQIIAVLNSQGLSVRKAGEMAGVQFADISRVRSVELSKFSVDWLTKVLNRLEPLVEVNISFAEREPRMSEPA